MTGGELQELVTGLADELGIWWAHFPDSRRQHGHPGWVDLTLLGPGGARFAEIKASGGKRSMHQLHVAALLQLAGLPYRIWHPVDWYDGTIRAELERIAR